MQAGPDTVYSIFAKPATAPKATILYFHGNGSNASKWVDYLKPLVADGFQLCMMDYRGYGKSTGKPTHLNIAEDAQALLDSLLEREDVRPYPLIIYGVSIGTQVAAHLTKNNNSRIAALVLDGTIASFTDIALLSSPEEQHGVIRQFVKSPYSAKEDIKEIRGVKLLFIHSEEDNIPVKWAEEMYDSSSCPKMFWKYEGKHTEAPAKYPEVFLAYINKLL
jgi:pimeloyl-ACP methyl ester carboxylesterase